MNQRMAVFVSYSHADRRWVDRLRVHLVPLIREEELDLWEDSRILAGKRWRQEIANAIDRAAVAVLLVSADFLASDFVASEELPQLLHKAESEGLIVIPLI